MHDIVHDFAQFLRKNECFSIKIGCPEESLINNTRMDKICHSMLVLHKSASLPTSIFSAQRLRSLLIFGEFQTYPPALGNLFDVVTCLRALTITSTDFRGETNVVCNIPNGIKNLIHLRYLKLSNLKEFPESCCELYNLQTLDIQECYELRRLPQGIGKLVSLRHLITSKYSLDSLPKEIGRLTGLRTLTAFIVSDGGQCNFECLKHLNYLQGFLIIRGLGNVTNVEDAKKGELEKKKNLSNLSLIFDKKEKEATERMNEEIETIVEVDHEAIIDALRPNLNIEGLTIDRYRGKIVFPCWLMSLTNLKSLTLWDCINCENMPPLGKLPSLEEIQIFVMSGVKRVGAEFLGIESDGTTSSCSFSLIITFPKLKSLSIYLMDEWKEWDFGISNSEKEDIRIMPNLNHLTIWNCPKLKSLPDQILQSKTLETLRIVRCPILEERFNKETGEDQHKISHIPKIEFD